MRRNNLSLIIFPLHRLFPILRPPHPSYSRALSFSSRTWFTIGIAWIRDLRTSCTIEMEWRMKRRNFSRAPLYQRIFFLRIILIDNREIFDWNSRRRISSFENNRYNFSRNKRIVFIYLKIWLKNLIHHKISKIVNFDDWKVRWKGRIFYLDFQFSRYCRCKL